MQLISTKDELDYLIQQTPMAVIFFSESTCSACKVVQEKLEKLLQHFQGIESREINIAFDQAIGVGYGVYSSPLLVLFVEGKESMRIGINIDFRELEAKLERYYELLY